MRLFGEDVANLSDQTRARIGYVPQQSDLFEWMTPRQMLDYFKALYPHWNDAKVKALLTRWGFDELKCARAISKLSGGESSACRSSARWPTTRNCWCWTSRCPRSTRSAGATSCAN
ncbi:hypothetical protein LP419_11665 [Massilia sp. H-1]|nr:hypothetical protein LP419_11665 [Massilia sp. H-1]